MKRILILYRELAGYFVECLNHLCEQYDVEAHVVAYPVNQDAPFRFNLSSRIKLISRNEIDSDGLVRLTSDPGFSLIFCGGWSDKEYLNALKHKKNTALLGFDNQWNASLKHILSSFYGRLRIKPLFDYAFVPGSKQVEFARHLGFRDAKIISGAYSCDVRRFSRLNEHRKNRSAEGNKRLIYAGRYAPEKFIQPLCSSVKKLFTEGISGWEFHCIGTGPLWNDRIEGDRIFHHGFMQPEELFEFMKTGDAFVLPSTFEPWGVVVHEFASAGYPLVLSDSVGSAEIFLESGNNGFALIPGDSNDLEEKLKTLFNMNEYQLAQMGERSSVLSQRITPDTWAKSLYAIM